MNFRRYSHLFRFAWKERRADFFVVPIAIVVALVCSLIFVGWKLDDWSFYDTGLSVATLAVAILVWVGEFRQDWENKLPKRLNVCFLHPRAEGEQQDYVAILCVEAFLSGEGDLRQWSQTVASQTANTPPNLVFHPMIEEHPAEPIIPADGSEPYKLYEAVFRLREPAIPKDGTSLDGKTAVWFCRRELKPRVVECLHYELTESGRIRLPAV
jgi:hypothetical protein